MDWYQLFILKTMVDMHGEMQKNSICPPPKGEIRIGYFPAYDLFLDIMKIFVDHLFCHCH